LLGIITLCKRTHGKKRPVCPRLAPCTLRFSVDVLAALHLGYLCNPLINRVGFPRWGVVIRLEANLEGHLVGLLAVSQAEAGLQVAGEEFFVLDCGQ